MGDVGEHGGAAGRDASGGDESVKSDQGVIDLLGFLEMFAFADEFGREVGGVVFGLDAGAGMIAAEGTTGIGGELAATPPVGKATGTARVTDDGGASDLLGHVSSFLEWI